MIVATCECGGEALFVIEDERKGPVFADCEECGQTYRLKVTKVAEGTRDLSDN